MAIFRNVHVTFWTDAKVVDDFTPEDKYFYIYLITNPHTNLSGCYEISMKQMSDELGYNKETIEKLIARFHEVHRLIDYSKQTKEMLLYNWHKYNWTKSPKFRAALEKELPKVKYPKFNEYLNAIFNGDTVSIPYEYGMDTTDTVTDTVTDTITVSDTDTFKDKKPKKAKKSYSEDEGLNNAIIAFIEFRKNAKKPMTDYAFELMLGRLNKMTDDVSEQIEILNQSIVKGWTDVYPLKGNKPQMATGGRNAPTAATDISVAEKADELKRRLLSGAFGELTPEERERIENY